MAIHFLKITHKICVYNFVSFPVIQRPRMQKKKSNTLFSMESGKKKYIKLED